MNQLNPLIFGEFEELFFFFRKNSYLFIFKMAAHNVRGEYYTILCPKMHQNICVILFFFFFHPKIEMQAKADICPKKKN